MCMKRDSISIRVSFVRAGLPARFQWQESHSRACIRALKRDLAKQTEHPIVRPFSETVPFQDVLKR